MDTVSGCEILQLMEKLSSMRQISDEDKNIISSFKNFFLTHGHITVKQNKYLNDINEKYCYDDAEWKNNFTQDMLETFKLAVKYYSNTPYFKHIVKMSQNDSNYIPKRNHYTKMCENKYFLRARENYKSQPKYKIGDMITVRKCVMYKFSSKEIESPVGIIETVDEQLSFYAHKRQYKIMWIYAPENFKVEGNEWLTQSDIKIYRQIKNKNNETNNEV